MNPAPNQYRFNLPGHEMSSTPADGCNGVFFVPLKGKVIARCIVSDGTDAEGAAAISKDILGWEHVSAAIEEGNRNRTPTWAEMCEIKSVFWGDQECVIQYHPAKRDYVNVHPHVLHLWKPPGPIPMPPKVCV